MSLRRPLMLCIAVALAAGMVVSGCGRKGDLYLPDTNPKKEAKRP